MPDTSRSEVVVLTDGHNLYERLRRGVYHRLSRTGERLGEVHTGFTPRVRWKPAKVCSYDIATDGLTCPRCGRYDTPYAMTGKRSFCGVQKARP